MTLSKLQIAALILSTIAYCAAGAPSSTVGYSVQDYWSDPVQKIFDFGFSAMEISLEDLGYEYCVLESNDYDTYTKKSKDYTSYLFTNIPVLCVDGGHNVKLFAEFIIKVAIKKGTKTFTAFQVLSIEYIGQKGDKGDKGDKGEPGELSVYGYFYTLTAQELTNAYDPIKFEKTTVKPSGITHNIANGVFTIQETGIYEISYEVTGIATGVTNFIKFGLCESKDGISGTPRISLSITLDGTLLIPFKAKDSFTVCSLNNTPTFLLGEPEDPLIVAAPQAPYANISIKKIASASA